MNNRQMLQHLLNTIQQDQIYLCCISSAPITASIRDAIHIQLKECMNLESEAANITSSRGWTLSDVPPGAKAFRSFMTKLHLAILKKDSRIVSTLILHHTKSMIRILATRQRFHSSDFRIENLAQCYLDYLSAAVIQLQVFL